METTKDNTTKDNMFNRHKTNKSEWHTVQRKNSNKKLVAKVTKKSATMDSSTVQINNENIINVDTDVENNDVNTTIVSDDEKRTKAKEWFEARNEVTQSYLDFLSYSKREIDDMIINRRKTIDRSTGEPYNYVTISCKAYDNNQNLLDHTVQNGFKFVLNQFFTVRDRNGKCYFTSKLKEHYKNLGYNLGFISRKNKETGFNEYTHLKVYFN